MKKFGLVLMTIASGVFRLATPWWLRWVFQLPWWFYGALALALVVTALNEVRGSFARSADIDAALAAPAPALVDVGAFDPAASPNDLGEVHLSGRWRSDIGIVEVDGKFLDFAFAVLEGEDEGGPVALLVTFKRDADEVAAGLWTHRDAAGRVEVYGMDWTGSADTFIPDLALERYGLAGRVVVAVKPVAWTREALYADRRSATPNPVWNAAFLAGLLAVMAGFAYRNRRNTTAYRNAQIRKARAEARKTARAQKAANPRPTSVDRNGVAPEAKKPVRDDFADGPIVSKKGFFG